MNSVPNRGGPHRALSSAVKSMYESMPDNQIKAIHTQSQFVIEHGKNEDLKPKFEERLRYTTPEMERRGL